MLGPRPWPDVRRVTAGGVGVDIAPEGLRHLAVRGHEVVANLYAAVRAPDWGTPQGVTVGEQLDIGDSRIVLRREERIGDHLRSTLDASWDEPGTLTASLTLTALADVEINRWGFNVCLDAADWAGAEVLDVAPAAGLPRRVAPQRAENGVLKGLFPPIPRLALRRADGALLDLRSDGQLLEAEDQRNWTDPTFKIYSGSLSDPLPIAVQEGTVLRQALRLVVDRVPPSARGDDRPAVLGPVAELPRLGVQANEPDPWGGANLGQALAALELDHVRIDVEHPQVAAPVATGAGGPVELAALVPDLTPGVLTALAAVAVRLPPDSRVLLHRTGRRTTDASAAAALSALLAGLRPDLVVVPGSDAYYADLNRDGPRCEDLVSFSVTPTVHAFDTESVFATLPVQEEIVRQCREVFGAAAVVSPVTLRLRGDPETPDTPASARRRVTERHVDERLGRLEGAAWTFGSVHALTRGAAYSGTWHELAGPRGLVRLAEGAAVVVPAFHALSVLHARRRPRVRPVTLLDGGVLGLLFVDRPRLVLSSQRPWEQEVRLHPWAPPARSRRRLRDRDLPAAAATLSWWEASGEAMSPDGAVVLEPFELTELRL
jgi:hypothetical protein